MTEVDQPPLAPPGAGLPPLERRLAGIGIKAMARFVSPQVVTRRFLAEARTVIDLARSVDEAAGRTPVRIARVRGIEDSSRDWSLFMTVSHLEIVNRGIASLMRTLCAGQCPDLVVRIEEVKPSRESGPERVEALQQVVAEYTRGLADLDDLRARRRHAHPWFGPLTARQWHALAAVHNRLHRVQSERIVATLRSDGRPG